MLVVDPTLGKVTPKTHSPATHCDRRGLIQGFASGRSGRSSLVWLLAGLALAACDGGGSKAKGPNLPSLGALPEVVEPPQEAAGALLVPPTGWPLPADGSGAVRLPGGQLTVTTVADGEVYLKVKGALARSAFDVLMQSAAARKLSASERKDYVGGSLAASLVRISESVPVVVSAVDGDVGYFTAWIPARSFADLAKVKDLPASLILNTVAVQETRIPEAPRVQDEPVSGSSARLDSSAYSGLKRIGALDFVDLIEQEVGERPDGASVVVGVTDTGVTLNHPSFESADGSNRIVYMKEFTGEGTAYFSPDAEFVARVPEPSELPSGLSRDVALMISAQYIPSPTGLYSLPKPKEFERIKDQLVLVDGELRNILLQPNSPARLGVILEKALSSEREPVDLNRNGSTNDGLWILAVPGQDSSSHKFYVDISGTGDFRNVSPVSDWNASKQTISLFAETFGLDVGLVTLLDKKGRDTKHQVIRAGLVGFDPGNHGSHVSGIIAGRKTIANDDDDTLARGVAPAARLAVHRVCANNGGCGSVEAVIDLAKNGVDLVNMSLGGLSLYNDGFEVDDLIYDRLSLLYGTQFFISAGNSGPGRNTVGSPSVARTAISIGASATPDMIERQYQWPGLGKPPGSDSSASDDFMLFFSSRGPSGAGGFKPNLAAPGTELSAIQLNAAEGSRSGLDVFWGTSMAAPTASGAYALFLDGIRRYNARFPHRPLLSDAITLRRILLESARPFDVHRFDPKTGQFTTGQYTWIDQGAGMLDLVKAWALLKAVSFDSVPSSVVQKTEPQLNGSSELRSVVLDYDVRVIRKNPNGVDYSGGATSEGPIDLDPKATQPITRYATGIWLDHAAGDSLVEVQLGRRLPQQVLTGADAGDLHRQLVTTQDTFEIDTILYGSQTMWLKPGTLNGVDCLRSNVSPTVSILGEGAIDNNAGGPGSQPLRASSLHVCLDRSAIAQLAPGDHGALIKLHRTVAGRREPMASIIVPVYLTVPHEKLADKKRLEISGVAKSFQVNRHYVNVPEGTSLVRVRVQVPRASRVNGVLAGCSGVGVFVLEAANTSTPREFADRNASIARSCSDGGEILDDEKPRTVMFERANPKAGIWDIHIMGRYNFESSAYTVSVDYANLESTKTAIAGDVSALSGRLGFSVTSSSFEVEPDVKNSEYALQGLQRAEAQKISNGQDLRVLDASGDVFRSYDESVASVVFTTGGATGSDIDLEVYQCTKKSLRTCKQAAASGTATDVERAAVSNKAGLYYVVLVKGFKVPKPETEFQFSETRVMAESDKGTVTISASSSESTKFRASYALDPLTSAILQRQEFLSGAYVAVGQLVVRSKTKGLLLSLGVTIQNPIEEPAN